MPPSGRLLGRVRERAGHVLHAHDVPPVVAAPDHREAAWLAQPRDELLRVPATWPVDVARADDRVRQPRLAHDPLALLLRASVRGLDRKRLVRVRAARRSPRRSRPSSRTRPSASPQPPPPPRAGACPPRWWRRSWRRSAGTRSRRRGGSRNPPRLRRRPGAGVSGSSAEMSPVTASVPGGSEPGRRTSATTRWPRSPQLGAGRPPHEPASRRSRAPSCGRRYRDAPVRASAAAASSSRSSPQNSSPPTSTVGTPNTPRACAALGGVAQLVLHGRVGERLLRVGQVEPGGLRGVEHVAAARPGRGPPRTPA